MLARRSEALSLALVVIFVLSALVASAAQASKHQLDVAGAALPQAVLTANSETTQTLETSTAAVNCKTAKFEGTVAQETENKEVTLRPTYSSCTLATEAATVTTNHCAYVLEGTTDANGDAPAKIECETGQTITVVTSLCTLRIGTQTPKGGVHYTATTNAGREEITIEATLSGIKYTKEGGFGCLFAGNGEDATYKGSATAAAYIDNGSPLSGTERTTPSFSMGAQRDLKLTTS